MCEREFDPPAHVPGLCEVGGGALVSGDVGPVSVGGPPPGSAVDGLRSLPPSWGAGRADGRGGAGLVGRRGRLRRRGSTGLGRAGHPAARPQLGGSCLLPASAARPQTLGDAGAARSGCPVRSLLRSLRRGGGGLFLSPLRLWPGGLWVADPWGPPAAGCRRCAVSVALQVWAAGPPRLPSPQSADIA